MANKYQIMVDGRKCSVMLLLVFTCIELERVQYGYYKRSKIPPKKECIGDVLKLKTMYPSLTEEEATCVVYLRYVGRNVEIINK